jgi:hypothetical protein
MTDIASLQLKIDTTQSDKAIKSLDGLTDAAKKIEIASKALEKTWSSEQKAINARAAAILKSEIASDNAADKAWALANGYQAVGDQLIKTSDSTAKSASSLGALGLNTKYARTEMMILGKEAMTGDFSRMPKTFGSLVAHTNVLPALLSPIGLGIGAIAAAAAAGAYAWSKWGDNVEEANKKAAKGIEETLKYADRLRSSTRTPQESLRELQDQIKINQAQIEYNQTISNRPESKKTAAVGLFDVLSGERPTQSIASTMVKENKALYQINDALLRQAKDIEDQIEKADKKKDKKEDDTAAKAAKKAMEAEQSYMKSVGDTTQSLIDKAAQETIEFENLGKTASQIAALEIARIDNQLAMKKEEAARLEGSKAKEDELFLIEQQIKALETLKDVQGKKGAMKDLIEDQKRYAELSKNAYENMAQGIASSISKSILYGKNLQESLVNVAYSVADAFLTAFLQIEIQKLLIGKTAQTSYASTMALEAEATVAQAGLNSFASTAAIPIVGPELAPAAAAAAMAAAQGMAATVIAASSATVASARNGFDIPAGMNPITQLHEKEMVLPAPQAQVIRDMAKSGGGGAQIIDNTTINIDSRSDRMQVMKDVQRMIENGHARLLDRMSRKGQIS